MNSYQIGQKAERIAAHHLRGLGFKIIGHNWRTRWCEIDLIAFKNYCVFFVEVKYRKTNFQGSGIDYITQSKLLRMQKSAESWSQHFNWNGEYCLSAIQVGGTNFKVERFIESID